jgi:hypothetical protein
VNTHCSPRCWKATTRTTAHALINFETLEVFTSTLPVAAGAAQVYEQIISMNQR